MADAEVCVLPASERAARRDIFSRANLLSRRGDPSDAQDGEKKRYQMVTVLPNGEELVWDVPGNSTDVMQAYWSFSQATERMLQAAAGREVLQRRQLQAIAPIDAGPHGLQVVQIGTEKVMARLEINPPGQAEKKAAFAALSAAIEATATQLPEEMYRQLYEKAKAAFNVCV